MRQVGGRSSDSAQSTGFFGMPEECEAEIGVAVRPPVAVEARTPRAQR